MTPLSTVEYLTIRYIPVGTGNYHLTVTFHQFAKLTAALMTADADAYIAAHNFVRNSDWEISTGRDGVQAHAIGHRSTGSNSEFGTVLGQSFPTRKDEVSA